MKVFANIQDSREAWAAQRAERWRASREAMARYLSSEVWYAKRDRAFLIWRGIGWTLVVGVLIAHAFPWFLFGSARLLLTWPVQDLAAFGLAYALVVRGSAIVRDRRLRRVGHHIGYTHVKTDIGGPEDGWSGCTERWYEIWPVTQAVNRTESLLRHDRPSPGFGRYFRRTLVAIALVRFWWAWLSLGVAVWFEGALTVHMTWGWALWHPGASSVLAWFEMLGHRI